MSRIYPTNKALDELVKKVCAPLFATDQFLQRGHDESTTNATVTFVRFRSRVYAVTCHHVLSTFFTAAIVGKRTLIPSIHSGRTIYQFLSIGPEGALGWSFQSCREFPKCTQVGDPVALMALDRKNADKTDIAIADLTEIWPLMSKERDADAIDLNSWAEPDWSATQPVWMAYGFPDNHKYRIGNKIAAPMARVSAALVSPPSTTKPHFILCSTLDADHDWGFSGISGGPVLVAHAVEDRYDFVGITFEGVPSTKDVQQNSDAFSTKKDIFLRGYFMNPQNFAAWLSQLCYVPELL